MIPRTVFVLGREERRLWSHSHALPEEHRQSGRARDHLAGLGVRSEAVPRGPTALHGHDVAELGSPQRILTVGRGVSSTDPTPRLRSEDGQPHGLGCAGRRIPIRSTPVMSVFVPGAPKHSGRCP
jgi:hypothetical protein